MIFQDKQSAPISDIVRMALSELKTEADYSSAVSSPCLTAVHFLASWAPECATVTAVLQELAREPQLQGKVGLDT